MREFQENEPRKKTAEKKRKAHLKTMESKSWTPIRMLRFPAGVAGKLKNLIDLNKHQNKKYDLAHPEFGIDLSILFDPNAKGTLMYQVQRESGPS